LFTFAEDVGGASSPFFLSGFLRVRRFALSFRVQKRVQKYSKSQKKRHVVESIMESTTTNKQFYFNILQKQGTSVGCPYKDKTSRG